MAQLGLNRFVGLVRFSYPALSGFTRQADPHEGDGGLYERARLERRFRLFEGLALPSLIAQSDRDFETIILVGDSLPAWARDRLQAGVAALPGAQVVALPAMHHYTAIQRAYAQLPPRGESHLTSFRLDDDDAMDMGHIERLRRISNGILQFSNPARAFAMGHNRGLFLDLTGAKPKFTEVAEKMPLGIGLALTAPAAMGETIFRRNHRLLPQFFSTYTDVEEIAFIRTVHDGNDSNAHNTGVVTPVAASDVDGILAGRFPFDRKALAALV